MLNKVGRAPDPLVSQDTAVSLHRTITWIDAFWVASGSPALILFTIGALAATVGSPSWLVWTVSITFGFLQCFTYAEIAGLFHNKSGGASIYAQTIPLADTMYLSYIKGHYTGDAYFPEFSGQEWAVEKREDHPRFEFVVYRRRLPAPRQ